MNFMRINGAQVIVTNHSKLQGDYWMTDKGKINRFPVRPESMFHLDIYGILWRRL